MKKGTKPGYGRILDAWMRPETAGDPIGCVATTFTFNSTFFEEECLSGFVQFDSDPTDDAATYLIERDSKLAQLMCASVLVDQYWCRGTRSLRWDLLCARVPRAILHAKVSLLCWSKLIRVIIASANLTEDGYRRNQEIFASLDFYPESDTPVRCLMETVDFLGEAATYATNPGVPSSAISRWNNFLDHVRGMGQNWGTEEEFRGRKGLRLHTVFSGPNRPDLFARLQEVWPDGTPPNMAHVTSPFFDPPTGENRPAKKLWSVLKQRGDAEVIYYVATEREPVSETILLHAPENLVSAMPANRAGVNTDWWEVSQSIDEENTKGAFRPMHLKTLWLENSSWDLYMIGSSNFTTAALGIGASRNLEANLAYAVCEEANKEEQRLLVKSFLGGGKIDPKLTKKFIPIPPEGTDEPLYETQISLPAGFGDATYEAKDQSFVVRLCFSGNLPSGWMIFKEDGTLFYAATLWGKQKSPAEVVLPWEAERPPAGFEVGWTGSTGKAWWPVNVKDYAVLPPPAELKDMPLELLLRIYTSARPAHQIIADYIKRKIRIHSKEDAIELDPHKRVDTSLFLLQRTRRLSWALNTLRERLERPVATKEALNWRLRGPIGILAISNAIAREATTDLEKSFLTAELALELTRVHPRETPESLRAADVRIEILKLVSELQSTLSPNVLSEIPSLQAYVNRIFQQVNL